MATPAESSKVLTAFVNGILLRLRDIAPAPDPLGQPSDTPQQQLPPAIRPHILTLHVLFPHALLDALDLLDRGLVNRLLVSDQPDASESASHGPDANAILRRAIIDEMAAADDAARATEGPMDVEPSQAKPELGAKEGIAPSQSLPALRVMHIVRSAQRPHHRQPTSTTESTGEAHQRSYQVSLRAWHCSCPAFAIAAFPPAEERPVLSEMLARLPPAALKSDAGHTGKLPECLKFGFGGLPARRMQQVSSGASELHPVCKHLMACVLAEAAPTLFTCRSLPETVERPSVEAFQGMTGIVEKWVSAEEAAGWAVGAGDV